MNKRLIVLLAMLCTMPIALAELKPEDIRFYVDEERDFSADVDGGDIDVKAGDVLDIKVYLDDSIVNITSVRLEGVIKDIDDNIDISKTMDWYSINSTKILSFAIPSDARKDDYEFTLKVRYRYSDGTEATSYNFENDWTVVVIGEEIKLITMEEALSNVSTMCNLLMGKMSTSFEYIGKYDGCSSNLSTCREERGKYESQSSECERTKTQCGTDKASCEQDKKECEEKMTQMVSTNDCKMRTDTEVETKVREAEKKKDNTMVGFGLFGGAVALIIYFRRKKGGSVHDKFYEAKRLP